MIVLSSAAIFPSWLFRQVDCKSSCFHSVLCFNIAIFLLFWKSVASWAIRVDSYLSFFEENWFQVLCSSLWTCSNRLWSDCKHCKSFGYSGSSRNPSCWFAKGNSFSTGRLFVNSECMTSPSQRISTFRWDRLILLLCILCHFFILVVFGIAKMDKKKSLDKQADEDAKVASKKAEEEGTSQYKAWYAKFTIFIEDWFRKQIVLVWIFFCMFFFLYRFMLCSVLKLPVNFRNDEKSRAQCSKSIKKSSILTEVLSDRIALVSVSPPYSSFYLVVLSSFFQSGWSARWDFMVFFCWQVSPNGRPLR